MIGRSRNGSSRRRAELFGSLLAMNVGGAGCLPADDPRALVIATPWPEAARLACAAVAADRAIIWVELGSHRWREAIDRRGGVDLILGGPPRAVLGLADADLLDPIDPTDPVPWRAVDRPRIFAANSATARIGRGDPRDDPAAFAAARDILSQQGWTAGYKTLARRPVEPILAPDQTRPDAPSPPEAIALVRSGRHPDQARRFLGVLASRGWTHAPGHDAAVEARVDDLLADLLGAALIDARNERRDAQVALEANHHPAIAEDAVGETPPWPPASVARLRGQPGGAALAASLLDQMTPDRASRNWLKASWEGPKRRVDLDLLRELVRADDGRLAREPRFRAWLRGEWTAWTQQLYRRVARLAGGYRPS